MANRKPTRIGSTITLLLLLGGSGCSVFPSASDQLALQNQPNPGVSPVSAAAKKVTLEVRPHDGSPRAIQVPLEELSHAQQAYERSREIKKFRRSQVEIYRPTSSGSRLRLVGRVDPKTKAVTTDTDYAIHPGDYVVVSEVPHSIFDEMLGHAAGPLKLLMR